MGPTWGLPGSCRPQVGPINLAIRVGIKWTLLLNLHTMFHRICTWFCCASVFLVVTLWLGIHMFYSPIFLFSRVASLALGQSYDCPSANEATLKDMGKNDWNLTKTKHSKAWTTCIFIRMYCTTCIINMYVSCCQSKFHSWTFFFYSQVNAKLAPSIFPIMFPLWHLPCSLGQVVYGSGQLGQGTGFSHAWVMRLQNVNGTQ